MKISPRILIPVFFLLVTLFFGLLNWQYVLTDILQPITLVLWLLLRIFVLSIDQQYYWWGLILILVVLMVRLIPREQPVIENVEANRLNETLNSIEHWRSLYIPNETNAYGKFLEREYLHMLVTMYSAKLRTAPDFKLYDALRQGEIPIPENIRGYLYAELPRRDDWSLRMTIKAIRDWPGKILRRATGRDIAAHYQRIEDVLAFFESSLEMNNDDENYRHDED